MYSFHDPSLHRCSFNVGKKKQYLYPRLCQTQPAQRPQWLSLKVCSTHCKRSLAGITVGGGLWWEHWTLRTLKFEIWNTWTLFSHRYGHNSYINFPCAGGCWVIHDHNRSLGSIADKQNEYKLPLSSSVQYSSAVFICSVINVSLYRGCK